MTKDTIYATIRTHKDGYVETIIDSSYWIKSIDMEEVKTP